jgi:hypothetical protein
MEILVVTPENIVTYVWSPSSLGRQVGAYIVCCISIHYVEREKHLQNSSLGGARSILNDKILILGFFIIVGLKHVYVALFNCTPK